MRGRAPHEPLEFSPRGFVNPSSSTSDRSGVIIKRMQWFGSLLSRRFVYERIRPLFLGELNYADIFGWLGDTRNERVIDIGCGFGDSLRYLAGFDSYDGFDLDANAIAVLQSRHPQANVRTHVKQLDSTSMREIDPTLGVAIGLLHHISDEEVRSLFRLLAESRGLRRIITLDTVHHPGATINNAIAALDRGRFVRTATAYQQLIEGTAFTVSKIDLSRERARRGLALYFSMCLDRRGE